VASIEGTVRCVQVGDFAGWTEIEDAAGTREIFILWFDPGNQIPAELTSFTRVLHSMWLSILREAHANNATVTVFHPDNSAEVTDVALGRSLILG
jgi:hypothetical protein